VTMDGSDPRGQTPARDPPLPRLRMAGRAHRVGGFEHGLPLVPRADAFGADGGAGRAAPPAWPQRARGRPRPAWRLEGRTRPRGRPGPGAAAPDRADGRARALEPEAQARRRGGVGLLPRVERGPARVTGHGVDLLLDAEELVVFGHAVR